MSKESFKMDILGVKELQTLLDTLPKDVNDKVQADINNAAAKVFQETLKANAPDGDNTKAGKNKLENNIVIRTEKGSKTDKLVGFTKRVFYVKFIEMGTQVRKVLGDYRKDANRGSISASPFVLKSHNETIPKVLRMIKENYAKIIQKSIAKQNKKVKNATKK